jgi:hypothetical protein
MAGKADERMALGGAVVRHALLKLSGELFREVREAMRPQEAFITQGRA